MKMKCAAAALGALLLGAVSPAAAARFITVPFAETMAAGRVSLWQLGLYEQKGNRTWRSLNRLDLGLGGAAELGVLVINPEGKPTDTWINLQFQPVQEKGWRPSVSVGVWDMFRKGVFLFSDKPSGPSPFLAVGKGYSRGKRYAKAGLALGANRLDGLSGGAELRFLDHTGVMIEYAPRNLRLKGADAWGAALYQWLGPHARVRVSRVGGNPMVDGVFTYAFGAL